MPEYTVSLLIWIIPIILFLFFFHSRRLLVAEKLKAFYFTVGLLSSVGIILDLLFARYFFLFPDPAATCGITITGIPIEEFIFYITGFWFILSLYVFCDEWYLSKYNPPDSYYIRFRSRARKMIYLHWPTVFLLLVLVGSGIAVKMSLNPTPPLVPGYFTFLCCAAYVPFFFFYRITKRFINGRAFVFTLLLTVLISVLWEVTLALPRGYWNYQHRQMVGVFITPWSNLPVEAITVWIFCTLVIMVYEFIKLYLFKEKSLTLRRSRSRVFSETTPKPE